MKLVFFIDIILFFAAEFIYEIFLFSVYYIFGCFTTNFKSIFDKK